MSDSPAAPPRRTSAAEAAGAATPPRQGVPAVPRSASVSASINFFESKSRPSSPPSGSRGNAGAGTGAVPSPRRESNVNSGSPKPVGPRTMTPPTREGRRLSYRTPDDMLRRSSDDQRKGLGLGMVNMPSPAGRRVSEGGAAVGMGIAGPSRIRPKIFTTGGSGSEPGSDSTKPRSVSHQPRLRASQPASPGAGAGTRESPTTRTTRPALQPRRPSDRPQPVIRVVQPTPRSRQAQRNTSAPPESPITPTRSRARAFSPVASSSKATSSVSASSTSISQQSPSSHPRSIKPGTRRTSYQLAKTASNDGSSAGSVSEFGVIGENGETPYGRFVESFDTSESGRDSGRETVEVTSIAQPSSPAVDVSPRKHHGPNSPVGSRSYQATSIPSSPLGAAPPPLRTQASETSLTTSSASSSFQSATSPSSPPNIPRRISSNPTSPRITTRTSSRGVVETTSPLGLVSQLPLLGSLPRSESNNNENWSADLTGPIDRRSSDATIVGPSRRPSTETETDFGANTRRSIGTGSKATRRPSSPSHQPIMESSAEATENELPIPVTPTPLPYTSPRRDRKSPGLTIDPVAPPRPPRDTARPSPPVPVKSPLRRLTPGRSGLAELQNGRASRVRDGSDQSTAATSSSVTGSFLTAPLPSDSDADEFVLQPGEAVPFPASYESHEPEEIRFTMLTVPSVYSQDSAPTTARSVADSESVRTNRSDSYGWGMQRHSISMDGELGGFDDPYHRTASLPRLRTSMGDIGISKTLPDTPNETLSSAATASSSARSGNVDNGHSPLSPGRSPSMPTMNPILEAPRKAARLLGVGSGTELLNGSATITRPPGGMTRSQTTPLGNLLPSSISPLLPTSPVSTSSKRAHLIKEIVNTERSYANDLALIRDAYMLRYIRPTSQVSSTLESSVPGDQSKPGSVYTYSTAETSRTSTLETSSSTTWTGAYPFQKSPGIDPPPNHGPSSFFPLVASASTSSLAPTHITRASSRTASGASSTGSMAPPIGKALSPADVRTVFLNLDQLAMAAEEMANAMDRALGDEAATPPLGRDGESGSDRLGETFSIMMPKFKPLYEFYCARQSTASVRLVEIQADPAHATFLNECWSHVKPHTHAWNLDSMLIKPIQRITKYPLLFDDMLACTTPVHPDYFNIRLAAEMARSVAQEIDETKRRKDVVAGVISKKQKSQSTPAPSGPNKPLGKGLKMFRKDKTAPTPTGMSSSSSALDLGSLSGSVPKIDKASLSYFKDLVYRFEQSDQCVKKFGKEVILWTAAAKDVCMIQDGVVKAWLGVISLDGLEGPDPKLVWFRKVVAGIVNDAWRALNDEVQDQIIPSLSKLLESGNNPRKVIDKRHSKGSDNDRYFSLYEAKKPIDRILVQSARDYFALHTQLMEELPLFLEGYMRIFDLCVVAFAHAQARYHRKVHDRLGVYVKEYLDGIKRSPRLVQGANESRARTSTESARPVLPPDLGTGAGVERHWREAWHTYANAVESFQIITPARQATSRIASFHDRPGSHRPDSHARQLSSHSRTEATGLSRSTSPLPPAISRTNTPSLSPGVGVMKDPKRNRSTSLMGPPPLPSPTREKSSSSGFFGLNKSKPSPSTQTNGHSHGHSKRPSTSTSTSTTTVAATVSPMKAIPRLRSPSPLDPSIRNSFGLPTISPDNGKFNVGSLGWSPSKPPEMLRHVSENLASNGHSRAQSRNKSRNHSRSGSTSSLSSNIGLGIGLSNGNGNGGGSGQGMADYAAGGFSNLLRRKSSAQSRKSSSSTHSQVQSQAQSQLQVQQGHDRRRKALSMASAAEVMNAYPSANPHPTPQADTTPRANAKKGPGAMVDAAAGWRGEKVLYQCACVASFDPESLGRRKYRGLEFLPMAVGDLFDIFHEVGRIDELPSFPYTEVGVENDGVLVAQGENGDIGLVICSFLEPLT